MQTYTVFVQSNDGRGTIHIQAYEAESLKAAQGKALQQVASDWQYAVEDLHILGVAAGSVEILEWDDLNTDW